MTVSYQYEVASSTSGGFTRLLLMWRGSLYKLIYRELLLFLVLFAILSTLYRNVFTATQKRDFEQIVVYCDTFISLIPLSFVLGFYVSYVAGRWWEQYMAIPWPDKVMHSVALYVTGNDEYGRVLRRSLMRYLNLSLILVLRSISSAVKRRFPTLDHVVDSGFMTALELELFQSVPSVEFNTYWIPCTWFINLLKEARHSQRLTDSQGLKIIMEEFNEFRSKCGLLWSYDWVSIPLVYTQVVTLATYSFFAIALVGRQYIEGAKKPFQMQVDIYLPLFTILQFFFFMGLLKVAEQLINPFGDDDEDFELNWLIDRHTKVSYLGVDTLMMRCPPLVKDIYFDTEDLTLPYTEASVPYKKKTYRGSVANMTVPEEKQTMFLPDISEELEETGATLPTPRASSVSLATHATDSPLNNRRQISESPPATPRLPRNLSETIIQFGEASIESEREHRTIADAVKKLASKSLYNVTPQAAKKSFFGTGKVTANLQPWPSATNIARYNAQNAGDMQLSAMPVPATETIDVNYTPQRKSSLKVKQCPHYNGGEQSVPVEQVRNAVQCGVQGIVNTAFSQERLSPSSYKKREENSTNCSWDSAHDENRLETCQKHSCVRRKNFCQHNTRSRPLLRTHNSPKYLVRRHKSMGSGKKKGVRWKSVVDDTGEPTNRRKTIGSVPTAQIIIAQTAASTPNLCALNENYNSCQRRNRDSDTSSADCSLECPSGDDNQAHKTQCKTSSDKIFHISEN
ncbi:bestrophin-4 isoform X1 [Neodiprion lecontei]|uniref:Bestrophin homolog n=2 Tax=Neodiprion lecontei TaxID=441921 RepID=A0A6J0BP40_NEOLC|nr:bestrophin-4 isoform X1 [Neodiprion lecontei]XP_015516335.2 bestrophin-4 isoform X1 [Neodiprion lecontei]XP_046590979.1 bestrophin-4 isoform X1 [Neodiprion lecontei]XP_046591079.1 bestrophin-4 isoform X1 [Neodiprion lecontei]XP_046591138.1 bestrophin-4 isoform X1 [Neodiprion lecontei]XP_046591206.1 bestrophin-4 isoform X1 [Neodiprion lecontei]XP_046591255.1 bestrophin-4 isoform X1 [Neodiprion lecontei]XP_046591307.1 bestrophin-4 isoform X1 [Neodiprion lecontei]XP_046591375.1 bestrophin-4